MPVPSPSNPYELLSKSEFDGLVIEHQLVDDKEGGFDECIKFYSTSNLD